MKFRTEGKPAPGELVVVHGFLNTWSNELGIEDFDTAQAAGSWLRAAGLWSTRRGPSRRELSVLREFRAALRAFVLDATSTETIDRLNGFSQGIGQKVVFGPGGRAQLAVEERGMTGVVGRLLGIVYTGIADDSWTRFKCCELETCAWAFYDYSKNHSGRWCSMKSCGSRHKARQYLKRKARRARNR